MAGFTWVMLSEATRTSANRSIREKEYFIDAWIKVVQRDVAKKNPFYRIKAGLLFWGPVESNGVLVNFKIGAAIEAKFGRWRRR